MNAASMWRHEVIDILVVAAVVIDLMLVTSSRMATAIRLNAMQAAILALMPLMLARTLWETWTDLNTEAERLQAGRLTTRLVHLADIEAVTAAA